MCACYSTHTRRVSCCRYAVIQGPSLDGCMFRWVPAIVLAQDVFLVVGMQLYKDRV